MTNADALRVFELAIDQFVAAEVPERIRDLRDAAALECVRGAVLLSPVIPGRLRGNWQTTIGAPAEGSIEKMDPTGSEAIQAAKSAIEPAADPLAPIWIHNGLPYARAVNDGVEPHL